MQYKKKFINDKILEAGLAEYLDKGYRQGNISTIALNAGVPVGNLYRYFDGKSGLLDALVKQTYNDVPKLIEQLARMDVEIKVSTKELMIRLAQMLINLFEQHGREMIILVDKCATTRYEDFADKIIEQVTDLVFSKLYGGAGTETDRLMSKIASKAFVNSMFDILRMPLERDQTEDIILRVLNFYFYELSVRI